MAERFRVTYATLSGDNEDLQAAYEQGLTTARSWFGSTLPTYVSGEERTERRDVRRAQPRRHLGPALPPCTRRPRRDVDDAVAAAKAAAPGWAATPWQDRVAIMRKAGDLISERSNELAALMSMEVGKNRLEALGDVEESAVFFRYYSDQMENNDGFDKPMDTIAAHETTRSVMRPYGVWGVISPFNFPMALAAGPTAGALVAGNTVVLKPSPQGTFSAIKLYECLRDAGLPADVFHVVPGGDEIGKAVVGARRRRRTVLHRLVRGRHVDLQAASPPTTRSRSSARWAARTPPSSPRKADLDTGRGRHRPLRVRLLRPEVLGLLARLRRARGLYEPLLAALADKAVDARGRRPDRPRHLRRPGHRRRPPCSGSRTPSRTPATTAAWSPAARSSARPPTACERPLRRPDRGHRPADRRQALQRRALRARSSPSRRSTRSTRRSTLANDTDLGLTAGLLLRRRRRGRPVPRPDRGRRGLRQPRRRCDHRRLARRPAVRRLEGLRHLRQGRWRPVLRPAVPSRAIPDGGEHD